jgi:6-phosphofructokinase 1
MQRITERQNNVVITDRMWARLLSSTNQPSFMEVKSSDKDKKENSLDQLEDVHCSEDPSVDEKIRNNLGFIAPITVPISRTGLKSGI